MKRVTGILLIAHAPLASAFASAAGDIGLPVSCLAALDVTPAMSREQTLTAARRLIAELGCDRYLVLTDLGGSCSPMAVARQLLDAPGAQVRIVTGLNMPMLATALCHAHQDVGDLARNAARRGADSVIVV